MTHNENNAFEAGELLITHAPVLPYPPLLDDDLVVDEPTAGEEQAILETPAHVFDEPTADEIAAALQEINPEMERAGCCRWNERQREALKAASASSATPPTTRYTQLIIGISPIISERNPLAGYYLTDARLLQNKEMPLTEPLKPGNRYGEAGASLHYPFGVSGVIMAVRSLSSCERRRSGTRAASRRPQSRPKEKASACPG